MLGSNLAIGTRGMAKAAAGSSMPQRLWVRPCQRLAETRLDGSLQIAQTLIALPFECHEPASHAAQVSPRRASFLRAKRNLLKVDEELFCAQLQSGNFVFKFTHRQGSPRRMC
jgi:hypothetical protein